MRYTIASAAQTGQLQALWQICFGDDASYTGRFLAHYPPSRHCFVACEGEKVAAMVHGLPCRLRLGGQEYPAAYLYAVATDPAFRGRGICRGLTAWAEKTLAEQGVAVALLVPASESLFAFYRGLGYETALFCDQWKQVTDDAVPAGHPAPVAPELYADLRQQWLPADSVLWPDDAWRYQALVSRVSGTSLYRLNDGCAVCEKYPGGLFIKELLGCADPKATAAALMADNDVQEALIRTPGAMPHGMWRWLTAPAPAPTAAWLGMAFD